MSGKVVIAKEQLPKETKQLARDLLVKFIDHEDLETIDKLNSSMEDMIDVAIEFELLLSKRLIHRLPSKGERT